MYKVLKKYFLTYVLIKIFLNHYVIFIIEYLMYFNYILPKLLIRCYL